MSLATIASAATSVASIISSVTTAIQNGETIATEVTEKVEQLGTALKSLTVLVESGLSAAEESVKDAFEAFNDLLGQVVTLLHNAGIMTDETRETIYAEYMAKADALLKGTSFEAKA
ncbi:MAG: hypothetical protein PHS57_02945 [Alphaproteobacteria bacterium]|nr:hypothetical protein [Alphaproteobacteria bacterium]